MTCFFQKAAKADWYQIVAMFIVNVVMFIFKYTFILREGMERKTRGLLVPNCCKTGRNLQVQVFPSCLPHSEKNVTCCISVRYGALEGPGCLFLSKKMAAVCEKLFLPPSPPPPPSTSSVGSFCPTLPHVSEAQLL